MDDIQVSSDRSFGVVFTVIFIVVALWPYFSDGHSPIIWASIVAAIFCAAALIKPSLLAPMNRAWMRFGLLLSRVMTPILLGIFFFGFFIPLAILMRLMGMKLLQLEFDNNAESYWINRNPPEPRPDSAKQQF